MAISAAVEIREATQDDAELLFTVQRASALAGFSHIFPHEKYPFPDEAERKQWKILTSSDGLTVLVAELNDRCVGVAVVGSEELVRFFVVPEEWGTGVADVLHEAALGEARTCGDSICRLWVLEGNQRGRRFYEKRGWRVDGRKRRGSFPPYP